jgi:hypothetical protein
MVKIGKRYRCQTCGTIVVCVRASDAAQWTCCGQELAQQAVSKLPSSD